MSKGVYGERLVLVVMSVVMMSDFGTTDPPPTTKKRHMENKHVHDCSQHWINIGSAFVLSVVETKENDITYLLGEHFSPDSQPEMK